jgi:hypothetical protein
MRFNDPKSDRSSVKERDAHRRNQRKQKQAHKQGHGNGVPFGWLQGGERRNG